MEYRKDKYGNDISILGYGCMRFTQKLGKIDIDKAEKEIMEAIDAGVNYFDTAYVYPGSEATLGEILARNNVRDKVKIATKLPHYLLKSKEKSESIFQEELDRLKTDHVDYYLMHMLTDVKSWNRLTELGIKDWLEEKRASGEIRQIGFSYHGNADAFKELVDAYDWDFCQIQYNYVDETSQAGVEGLRYANEKGLPVIIMEPLRGGKLAVLSKASQAKLDASNVNESAPALAFRWLWNQPEVSCVLSGMNSLQMVQENVSTAARSKVGDFTDEEKELVSFIKNDILKNTKVPCTGCRYCCPCPKGVDIPGTFAAYNQIAYEGKLSALYSYSMCTILRKDSSAASNCVKCGACEAHCPQGIKIREELENAKKELETPLYKIASKVVPIFMKY